MENETIDELIATKLRDWSTTDGETRYYSRNSAGVIKLHCEQYNWKPTKIIRQAIDSAEDFKLQGCRWWKLESSPTGKFHMTVVMYNDCTFVDDRDYVIYEHEEAEVAMCMALLIAKGIIDYD